MYMNYYMYMKTLFNIWKKVQVKGRDFFLELRIDNRMSRVSLDYLLGSSFTRQIEVDSRNASAARCCLLFRFSETSLVNIA